MAPWKCLPWSLTHVNLMVLSILWQWRRQRWEVRGGSLWARGQPERPCFNKVEDENPPQSYPLTSMCAMAYVCLWTDKTITLEHNFKQATIFWMLLFYSTLSSLERVTWLLLLWRTGITSCYFYLLHRGLKLWPSFVTPVQRFLQRNICSHLEQQIRNLASSSIVLLPSSLPFPSQLSAFLNIFATAKILLHGVLLLPGPNKNFLLPSSLGVSWNCMVSGQPAVLSRKERVTYQENVRKAELHSLRGTVVPP